MILTIALFGEAEKGPLHTPFLLHSLPELPDNLGNPPKESQGLFFAVQALLYHRELIFFRVEEEGFSVNDYMTGLNFLKNNKNIKSLDAICLPGVGNKEIIEASINVSNIYKSLIITTEKDLFDYLTH